MLDRILSRRVGEVALCDAPDRTSDRVFTSPNGFAGPDAFHVHRFDRGCFIAGQQEVYASNFKAVSQLSSYRGNPARRTRRSLFNRRQHVAGCVANLSMSGLASNYYHLNVEFFARLELLRRSPFDVDLIAVDDINPTIDEMLTRFGWVPDRRLVRPPGTLISADQVVVPDFINNYVEVEFRQLTHYQKQWVPDWVCQAHVRISEQLSPRDRPSSSAPPRIYIGRGDAERRRVLNEDRVIDALKQLGFVAVTTAGLKLADQRRLFADAKIVVGPHGAGLVNTLYSRNVSPTLIELFPRDYPDSSFSTLAEAGNWHYVAIKCDSIEADQRGPQFDNLIVDVDRLVDEVRRTDDEQLGSFAA